MGIDGDDWLTPWCVANLGAVPVETLHHSEHMSAVYGLRLADGRRVAVKAREDPDGRTASCVAAQAHLAERGYPCARPLTGVVVAGVRAVHAEEWRPGGELLRGDSPDVARRYAEVFADLMARLAGVTVVPPRPSPHWLRWDHPGPGIWPALPWVDDRDQSVVPAVVVDTAARATQRLREADLPCVLGHADFEAQNLRWQCKKKTEIWSVHDWDSLAWLPEAALVGAASGAFASAEIPTLAPVPSSAAFLDAYEERRGRRFTAAEREVAWAASLWPAAHNARVEALFGTEPVATAALTIQADERLRRAGA